MNKKILSTAIIATFSMGVVTAAEACTRLLWDTQDQGTFVSRTVDWSEPTNVHLVNIPKNSAYLTHLNNSNQVTSKYDVTGLTTYRQITDGMNSEGLSGNVLYDRNMDTDDSTQADDLGTLTYLKHVLSQFSTVEEAVKFVEKSQPAIEFVPGIPVRIALHISLQDTSGDSAIIEFRAEGPRVWHGAEYTVMTNQPDYDQHLANVERSKRGWGPKEAQYSQTNLGTGGNANPEDRFVHSSYYMEHLTEPSSVINGMVKLDSLTYKIPHDAPIAPIDGVMSGYATEYAVNYHLQSGETLLRYQWGDDFTQLQYNMRDIQESGKAISFQLIQPGLIGDVTETIIKSAN
ncbi:linear amide C-N hydrolase [Vibrio splendidus]|uniref:linear amide C-N hydrolase n=1 Tax=Vibrio splendidus TaxID=29497 RepID=UPI000C866166|nr:linear amide C-N hydrolase [Vibrio splendidus]PMG52529.1 choloylglycine hydrolase [Vibrio splendidus]